ncbi:triphosphoribosyl-dephospho-CoA synthase MdcB [Xanthobacter autotrophicus]|uniref:triphosphoribosyl-dephospho-CoA synthase MdcB n=1 Tax=Xanthobacter autotrophicus TaxID=280 RepID=UPI0024A6E75F|nr:triphosphoribosyl-dephospho-CoA synthase MdcB [Xanthobacter autotrophicus]MDI4656722.1 triphosphoribosyl-dephospho-CoA synthase MdcB [Xanthobacter autotrophicus]
MRHVREIGAASRLSLSIGQRAVTALHQELVLYPKPGLVSLVDNGAHDDMDAVTFLRSLFALRRYFQDIADAGMSAAPFSELQRLGIAAEARMLKATGGINTHRGAIFCIGLLAAATGFRVARGLSLAPDALVATVLEQWGDAIAAAAGAAPASHGRRMVARFRARGAREEVLSGFPTLMAVALPALKDTLARLGCAERARVQTLFAVMARLDDTNLLHRGGADGLAFVRMQASAFLEAGGVAAPDWRARALGLHHACIARHLSPGGSADILAAAIFVQSLDP